MANITNEENWASRERLRCVERAMWWRGWVGRRDLTEVFGISPAQASGDLQRYQELNPGALVYHTSRKRYEAVPGGNWVVAKPNLAEGLAMYLGGGDGTAGVPATTRAEVALGDRVVGVGLPVRSGRPNVERLILMATTGGLGVRVRYRSVGSGKVGWRCLRPHAFGHDGYRWHVRAWCAQVEDYRDFVLGRIEKAEWPEIIEQALPADREWQTIESVTFRPHRELSDSARRAIELDYGIARGGVLRMEVSQAMKPYLLAHLRVATLELPQHFELAEQ